MTQEWKPIKWLFGPEDKAFSNYHYTAVPIAQTQSDGQVKVYFSTRDKQNRSNIGWISLAPDDDFKVIDHGRTHVELGRPGCFDEDGIMPTSIIHMDSQIYMYYIGWNVGHSVPFRNSVGLLTSNDHGMNFKKFSNGPLLDRSIYDPCFVASCEVLQDEDEFRMWYLSCVEWMKEGSSIVHKYHIKYARSTDGIFWQRHGHVAIDFKNDLEYAISVPRVIKQQDDYEMWYSYRSTRDNPNYQIGYACSTNGIDWERRDEIIDMGPTYSGMDNEMRCYPYIFKLEGEMYMLYNGNDYGKTGIGLAIRAN